MNLDLNHKKVEILNRESPDIMESESDHWEPELMESQLLGHDHDDLSLEIEDARVKKKRGPKKIPPLWSGLYPSGTTRSPNMKIASSRKTLMRCSRSQGSLPQGEIRHGSPYSCRRPTRRTTQISRWSSTSWGSGGSRISGSR